jgi:hypothetical protein
MLATDRPQHAVHFAKYSLRLNSSESFSEGVRPPGHFIIIYSNCVFSWPIHLLGGVHLAWERLLQTCFVVVTVS